MLIPSRHLAGIPDLAGLSQWISAGQGELRRGSQFCALFLEELDARNQLRIVGQIEEAVFVHHLLHGER